MKLFIANNWRAIRALKTALLESDHLTGPQIQAIVDEHPSEAEREQTELLDVIKGEFQQIMSEFRRDSPDVRSGRGQLSGCGYR
jgi:hypothetical protein